MLLRYSPFAMSLSSLGFVALICAVVVSACLPNDTHTYHADGNHHVNITHRPYFNGSHSLGYNTSSTANVSEPFNISAKATVDLVGCLNAKGVDISQNSSSDWTQLVQPFNLRLPYTPITIALPTTPGQVAEAVQCASAADIKVQARSGGHSYASFSLGGQNGSMVIDLQAFQDIVLDPVTGIARVGGGVRLGNLALEIFEQGKRALPHGTCPGVGIGGHFTHGGYGYDSRLWGLALDTIIALDVVLANGTYITATNVSNPDIYFAMRGAADSFGIVTNFYLQTQPAPDTVIDFDVKIPGVLASKEAATAAFLHLQHFAQNASVVDRNITFGVYIDQGSFSISGMYFGGEDSYRNKILPELLRGLPTPDANEVHVLDWISALVFWSGFSTLAEPLTGYDHHDTFFAKSIVTQESKPLTESALESFFGYMVAEEHSNSWFVIINLYGGPDSQISAKSTSFAAYPHRSSLWVFQLYGYTSDSRPPWDPTITTHIQGLTDALLNAQPDGDFAAYLNYVDPTYTPAEAHLLYFGDELYAKLLALKQELDPKSVFWNPQAVGTV